MKGGIIMDYYYIYKIENQVNHKKYIGLTNNIQRRRARHYNRHDNSFLQKEYNIYGKENFTFNIEFEGQASAEEIGDKEKDFIKFYDSYRNGYNQNEGGNFGPANGGSHLTQSDIFNILAALEFMSRPGQILSNMFKVSKTTISRIKHGENHIQYKREYEQLPFEERQKIYQIFCESTNFYKDKVNTTILKSKRKLNKIQVFAIYANEESGRIIPLKKLTRILGLKSDYALRAILEGKAYRDYAFEYQNLSVYVKDEIVSMLSNQQGENPLNCGEVHLENG